MNMLDLMGEKLKKDNIPLADRMKPKKLSDFYGQEKFLGENSILKNMILKDSLMSIIFYGPSGSGKTSIAKIISNETKSVFIKLNAVTSGVVDIRNAVEKARLERSYGNRTILFIDEIHRFNKKQQDALLPYVESGLLTLIGATTENPYFEVNSALISRLHIIPLNSLEDKDIKNIINNALKKDSVLSKLGLSITSDAMEILVRLSGGDARKALNTLELVVSVLNSKSTIEQTDLEMVVFSNGIKYDRLGDNHYDTISAFIKSVRGSNPDAALHYLAKMLVAGEDLNFILRRLIILASEDIGNADPNALVLANSVRESVNFVGMPEARILLGQLTTYLATCPKSNRSYLAINKAIADIETMGDFEVPVHLKDASYKGAKNLKNGENYKYPHDYKNAYVKQNYMPNKLIGKTYYEPSNRGREKYIKEFIDNIKKL
ncbi:MAG: replication-associated recombination protein RarA [Clostridiales bacterium]|nr:MAG: replication-associated recombination protein RarA [Clostridiales bacterium]